MHWKRELTELHEWPCIPTRVSSKYHRDLPVHRRASTHKSKWRRGNATTGRCLTAVRSSRGNQPAIGHARNSCTDAQRPLRAHRVETLLLDARRLSEFTAGGSMGTLRCWTFDSQNVSSVSNVAILPEYSFHKSAGFLADIVEGREDSDQRFGQSDLDARSAGPVFREWQ